MTIRSSIPALLLAALLVPVPAPPALAQATIVHSIEILPGAPNALDEVRIQFSGTSTCAVVVDEVTTQSSPLQVTVALGEACNIDPAIPRPFSLVAEAGLLEPGDYRLRIVSEFVVGEEDFTVFVPADLVIETADAPYTNDSPVVLEVVLYEDNGLDFEVVPRVELGVVEVLLDRFADPLLLPTGFSAQAVPVDLGLLPAGDYEVRLLDTGIHAATTRQITVHDAEGCVPSPTALCLGEGRFRVDVEWRDFEDRSGQATAVPLSNRDDTGAFWFFQESNLELTVKVLRGCGVNGHYWVFLASGSTVEYEVTVTDTESGLVRRYGNELGQVPNLVPDTAAFATCP